MPEPLRNCRKNHGKLTARHINSEKGHECMTPWTLKEIILNGLMFLGIIVTFVWIVLKKLGYIHTPLLIEMLPFIASFVTILIFVYHLAAFVHELRPLPQQMRILATRVDALEQKTSMLERIVHAIVIDIKSVKLALITVVKELGVMKRTLNTVVDDTTVLKKDVTILKQRM